MKTPLERFEEKFTPDPNTGCWLWTACLLTSGYGSFWDGKKSCRAHRFSWENHNGPLPDGLFVLHKCDQPLCVRPAHLFLGTHADNVADRNTKGRQASGDRHGRYTKPESTVRGGAHHKAKVTEKDILAIRAATGQTQKQLAARYSVDRTQISNILRRKSWEHV